LCCNNANILNEVLERPKDTEDVTCSLEYIDAKDDELTEELLALDSCVARYTVFLKTSTVMNPKSLVC